MVKIEAIQSSEGGNEKEDLSGFQMIIQFNKYWDFQLNPMEEQTKMLRIFSNEWLH